MTMTMTGGQNREAMAQIPCPVLVKSATGPDTTPMVVVAAALYLLVVNLVQVYPAICLVLFGSPWAAVSLGLVMLPSLGALGLLVFGRHRSARYLCQILLGIYLTTRLLVAISLFYEKADLLAPMNWVRLGHAGLLVWLVWGLSRNPGCSYYFVPRSVGSLPRLGRFVGWLVSVPLVILVAVLLTDATVGVRVDRLLLTFSVAAANLALLGFALGRSATVLKQHNLDQRGYVRGTLLFLTVVIALVLIARDPATRSKGLKWGDLPVPQANAEASYQTMRSFAKPHAFAGVPAASELRDIEWDDSILAHADLITRAWEETASARAVVTELDRFEAIADLRSDWKTPVIDYTVWRDMAYTCAARATLSWEQGDPAHAAELLSEMESIARKSLPYTRTLVGKMIMVAIHNLATERAFALVMDPQCTLAVLGQLAIFHEPLTDEMGSMRTAMSAERLMTEEAVLSGYLQSLRPEDPMNWMIAPMVRSAYKPRTARRMVREYYEVVHAGVRNHPPSGAEAEAYREAFENRPRVLALAPWYINRVTFSNYSRAISTANNGRVMSEFLAMEIDRSLGGDLTLPDFFYGPPYQRDDEPPRWTSAGPDKTFGNDDDIVLGDSDQP